MSLPRSTDLARPLGVAVLGSTGSIGRQAIDVLEGLPDSFRIVALATGTNAVALGDQAARLRPAVVALDKAATGTALHLPFGTGQYNGPDALTELATRADVDLVVVGTG